MYHKQQIVTYHKQHFHLYSIKIQIPVQFSLSTVETVFFLKKQSVVSAYQPDYKSYQTEYFDRGSTFDDVHLMISEYNFSISVDRDHRNFYSGIHQDLLPSLCTAADCTMAAFGGHGKSRFKDNLHQLATDNNQLPPQHKIHRA